MPGIDKPTVLGIVVAFIFAFTPASPPVVAEQATGQTAPMASLTDRLNAAKSVFVSNSKGESVANEKARGDRAATSFSLAMQSWNRYPLAQSATEADLLMQVSLEKSQIRLTILDPNTHAVLASLVEPVESGFFGAGGRSLNQATSALMYDLRRLTIQRAAPVPPYAAPVRTNGNQRPKVFMSNVGSNDDLFSGIGMSSSEGGSQAFNKFYAAIQSSGQFALVSSPTDAAFIFEMHYTDPEETTSEWRDKPGCNTNPCDQESVESTVFYPQLHLVILDASTHAVQGTFTEFIKTGNNQPQRDARFSQALNALVNDACIRLGRPPANIFVSPVVNAAPVPPQIIAAKTVFISNAGGTGIYGGTPSTSQAYNEFYAMMKSWGGYQLSSTVTGADLIFEVSANSRFRVAILDPRTKATLWGFTPDVRIAILKSNSQKNFDYALVTLVQNIARMAGRPGVALSVPQSAEAAPVPSQIISAKTAFIANGGEESLTNIKGTTTYQAYNNFYATMKSWGRYELVPAPSQADLVIQMSLTDSTLRVTITDPKTHVALWDLKQNFHGIFRDTVQPDDFKDAIVALVKSVARLAGQPAAEISVPAEINSPPLPSQIGDSRKVFLSRPVYEGATDKLYNSWYANLKSWGRYELTTPDQADLIFDPFTPGSSVTLTIRDAKTRDLLWTFTRPVKYALLPSNAKKNYTAALSLLMDDVHHALSVSAATSTANAVKHEQNDQE